MQDFPLLEATKREHFGTPAAKRLRKQGLVPGIIYGSNKELLPIIVSLKELTKLYEEGKFSSRVLKLKIDDKLYHVLPKYIELDRIKDHISHIDFVFLNEQKQELKVPISFEHIDRSSGIKRGGYFNIVCRSIKLLCPANDIPRYISLDVSNIPIGKAIKAKDLTIPASCTLRDNNELVIASIIGRGVKEEPVAPSKAK